MPDPKIRYLHYRRLEPARPVRDLARGFRAEIHDPLWFLGRQWEMGEHLGEDASSPLRVHYESSEQTVTHPDSTLDLQSVPPEAFLEDEPDSWWTPGRRIRIGMRAQRDAHLPLPADRDHDHLLLSDLPSPYQRFEKRGYDGWKLFEKRRELRLSERIFAEVPAPAKDYWDPARFAYSTDFETGTSALEVHQHRGGRVDWYSADGISTDLPTDGVQATWVYPTRLSYPGSPHPRWWQIENARVDIGGYPPDRSHFATLLLIDLIASHSDDWFVFPGNTTAGSLFSLHKVTVHDSFDDTWEVHPPGELPGQDRWTLFSVRGLNDRSLLIWPTAVTPLTGPRLEEVVLGTDEDANILWAVELKLNGREVVTAETEPVAATDSPEQPIDTGSRRSYSYAPHGRVLPHWQPYVIEEVDGKRMLVQGRLADFRQDPPELFPPATARVLRNLEAGESDPVHLIDPGVMPNQGMRLQRRYCLARTTDGSPVLWLQRHRQPLLAPPALRLRHDILDPAVHRLQG